jgi:NAD(P) transhydrogenase subunit beta
MYGLKRMSSPVTAPSGIFVAGFGMLARGSGELSLRLQRRAAAKPHLIVNIGLAARSHWSLAAVSLGGAAGRSR